MLTRILAASTLTTFSLATAHAGTLQNGAWTPNCPAWPGDAPEISSKSPDAYNKSAKAFQAWQGNAKAYVECTTNDAKTDQSAIVTTVNGAVTKYNDEAKAGVESNDAAIETLKKKGQIKK